ncbi:MULTISPECIES: non-ribosomal peptide synthase/polyketide synthase [unclassified Pseudomonas]|uniref:non-ribosomal peptide synthase/polyketide synthase n=1 Tax=unclassified Pseudomonas TaxID=196821 RepID=UPI0021C85293|nr:MULTISPECIES: non-ribosomal peptide synthase/polyketide synthase [unclassified Pseudomonas]MCU1734442.1 non-ribosomal peptide synthase/polyketide synthase [Pseudomonas sp. 20P_3.2_Bac4]MCU1745815.1 non-ribosomal peptide synthase/polyketide synthase [Pseudomonas sp. 20P_3.2_Bac5]
MDKTTAERIAKRFVSLPLEQRRQILDKMRETGQSFRLLPIAVTRTDVQRIPLSYAQQRMLFLWQMEPDNSAYNVPMAVRLSGALDAAALAGALEQLVQRHETLRTRFVSEDGEFHQEILEQAPVTLEVVEVSTEVSEDAENTLKALVEAEMQAPFDLLSGTLLRVKLFRLGTAEHVLTLCMHHVVSDGWSSQLLVREFVQLYQARISGTVAALPALPVQYADYAIWQRAWLEAGEGERQLQYWKQQLGDEQPVLALPLDHERPQQPSYRGAVVRADLSAALSDQLKRVARSQGVTVFMLTLAALSVVLSRYSGQADIRIGAPNAGRTRSELEGLIGFFINTQVLRVQVDERQTFAELLEQVKQVVTGAQSHQELPFEHLVDALAPERNLGHNPLFQFKINQQVFSADEGDDAERGVDGLSVDKYAFGATDARFDLAYDFIDTPQGLRGYFTYATDLFEAATIERIVASLRGVLENLVAHPGDTLLAHAEPAPLLATPPAAAASANGFLSLWQQGLLAGQDKPALRAGEQVLSYAQLDAQSNQLAHYLRAQGIGAGMTVALCQERGIEWVTSLLAVLKLGAVYLPLDTRQPLERLQQLTRDSRAALLIHAPEYDASSFDHCPTLAWDANLWAANPSSAPEVTISASQPAYIIYTSGSTGQPKGVVISHGALSNYVQGVLERLALSGEGSMAMVSTIAADLGHTLLFGALASGRTLHLLSHEHAFDPDSFAAYMAEQRIEVLKIVPSHLQGLLQAAKPADVLPAQLLILGGEASSWNLVEQVRALKPGCRILNHYGPTETTVGILTHEVGAVIDGCRSVPVGQPLAGARARVLDAWLNPVAERVAGELYLGGAGLAQGYLGQPALTAERFVPDADGQRLYRSGDRARHVSGGLEYLGRADDQVKIRGYRVEPGEVGHVLRGLDGVAEAVVLALPQDGDESRLQLVGYCAAASGVTLQAEALRQQLAANLPEYLVPAQILLLERLPLTANGKLDKRALPKPGAIKQAYTAPVGEIEEKLAAVWADVLKLERVGTTDNFFELGGDSILSLQIIARAKRQGIKLSPKQLFEKQTIGQLAAVAKLIEKKAAAPVVEQLSGNLPLLPIQARFFETDIPQRHHWNQAVMLKPTRALDAVHLQVALHALVEQHDALRLSFVAQTAGWQASFAAINSRDLLWVRELDAATDLNALANEAQRSLDLTNGPLLRGVLVNLAQGEQRLLLVIHHLVVDGVSWRVLLEDLQQAYAALVAGKTVVLPAKSSSLKAWAEKLHGYAANAALEQELGWWQTQLHGASDSLPWDHSEGSQQRQHAISVSTHLDAALTRKLLQDAPAAYRTQINDLLLTALARVISRWTARADAVIRLEGHGREDLFDDIDLSRTVGWFSNLYPVRLTPAASLDGSIKAIKEQLRAIPDKGIGYGVLRYLGTEPVRASLAQLAQGSIVFNYLGQFDGSFDAGDALFAPSGEASGDSQDAAAPLSAPISINGQVYGGELDLSWSFSSQVFERATIQRLADEYAAELRQLIEHCTAAGVAGMTPSDFPLVSLTQAELDHLPVAAGDVQDIYPLSPMQQGMLFHTLYEEEAGNYINQLRVEVEGLDIPRFRAAWQAVVDHHEALRSVFVTDLAQPLQVVLRQAAVPFVELDARNQVEQGQWLDRWAAEDRSRGFDLVRGPLLRLAALRTTDDSHQLIYTSHHILMDGWSTSRMLGEVLLRYSGQHVAQPGARYRDYIEWLQGRETAADQHFWSRHLDALDEPTRLVQAFKSPARGEGYGERAHVLDVAQTQRLSEFAREQRVTLNTLVQAAWLLLLHRYTGQSTVTFGATVAGRPAELSGIEEQLGLFINTLPVVGSPRSEQTVADWVQQVQSQNVALREHEHTPLYDIQRWAGLRGEALFDNILVFENYPVSEALQQTAPQGVVFGGLSNQEQAHYPLTLVVNVGASLSMRLSHDRQYFSDDVVAQLAAHLDHLLQALIVDAAAPVGELALPSNWHQDVARYPSEQCIHQVIEAQAARVPEAIALTFGSEQLTYAALNTRANQLAHKLREQGVGPDVLVGLSVERGFEMLIGVLAILKAGGAYVPLDPDYPQDRLSYMMEDSGISLLLAQSDLLPALPVPASVQSLRLDESLDGYSRENPVNLTSPDNLAYVIYTSGSTGKPKGTLLPHHNVLRLFKATDEWFNFDGNDVWTLFHSYAFDFSVWEIFGALMYGGRLVVVPREVTRSPEEFHQLLVDENVTVLNQTPSAFKQLARVACESSAELALRYVVFGGEALDIGSLQPWFERFGDQQPQLINMYGITETTVHVTYRPISKADLLQADVSPIGVAIPDLSWHVLDTDFNPVALGVSGELHVGHAGLARGYHHRAALTAERFVPNPFAKDGSRLYRTGDLARYRAEDVIEYAGRIDHQVKIRGFRIELGEIEARLQEHAAVREVIVLAVEGPSGQQLAAYLVPQQLSEDPQGLRETLKAHLKANLPDYMVPTHLIVLDAMPLTANGKLDRKALPKPDAAQLQGEYVAPVSELEQQLAAIWAEVLKVEQVGLTDNFFELGGDSIISIQVVSRARHAGLHFTPKDLFQRQTVQSLALVARRAESTTIDQAPVTGLAPLTPVQQWFFDSAIPQRHHWNQAVMLKPSRRLDAETLDRTLRALLVQHDGLRLGFSSQNGAWLARHEQCNDANLLWQRTLTQADELDTLADLAQRSLDLEQGHLLRAVLADLPDGSQRVLLVIHHLVVDGVSWRILLEDLQQAYTALAAGKPLDLPRKTSSFKAWGEHLHDYARSPALEQELTYWQAQLAGISDELPCSHRSGELSNRHVSSVTTRLDSELTRQLLQDAPAAYRTQINDLLLTALARVICQWTQQPSALIKLEGHGREDLFDDLDITRTVGWFTSIYPVKLSPQPALSDSIKAIKEQLRAIPNKGIGYGVLRYMGTEAARQSLGALAKGTIVFNYLGQFDGSFSAQDALFAPSGESRGDMQSLDAPLDSLISVSGQVYGGHLELNWRFSTEVFERSELQGLADRYAEELQQLISHCVSDEAAGATPSDFPLAQLEQAQLDRLPVALAGVADIYPLSPMQQGMLFHSLYEKDAGNYVNQMRVDVRGLDVARFKAAWQAVIDQHEVLRACFVSDLERPLQVIRKQLENTCVEQDWRSLEHDAQALKTWARADRQRGFDLERDALLRLTLLRTDDATHHLIYTSHHILMDGWSNSRLLGEVLQRYHGQPPAPSAARYRDYIEWLQRQDGEASQRFWSEQLAVLEEPTRLGQVLKPATDARGYTDQHYALGQHETRQLSEFAREQRVTLNTLVQAAWLLLLHRYTGQSSVTFGATVAGRPAELPGIEEQLGLFINTLPVVGSPRSEQTVADWVQQVQNQNLALREHEHTPLYDIQRWAGHSGDALFDSILVFENYPVSEALQQAAPEDLVFGSVLNLEQTHYPLTLIVQAGEVLGVRFNFDRQRFSEQAVARLVEHFDHLLRGLIVDAAAPVGELALPSNWHQDVARYPSEQCVHQMIEAQAARVPDAVALSFGGEQLTYAALNARANQLAHKLREQGVGPDVLVGLSVERGFEMLIGVLAILKAGGAYVPLDPDYPQDRLSYMMEDSGIKLLLAQSHLLPVLPVPAGVQSLRLDESLDGYSRENPVNLTSPDNLAYVIYTSGSTGKPKGTLLPHHNVLRLFKATDEWFNFDGNDVWTLFHSYAFDFSVWEIFGALMYGGRLVVVPREVTRSPEEFHQLLVDENVTVLNQTPSAFKQLARVACESSAEQALRYVVFGGEALDIGSLQPWFERFGDQKPQLINMYGITETTVHVTYRPISKTDLLQADVSPIGEAIPDLSWHVLDTDFNPVALGVSGELHVGHAGLARGYHHRAALTAERFVPNPFAKDGSRLYRTGDLARYRAEDVIEYAGRIDHQVKIRGFRIELGEIEARLQEHAAVREVIVLAVEGPSGQQLAAYLVPQRPSEDPQDLRETLKAHLKANLPDYMVPTHLIVLDAMPLTANGKLDRKALPKPDAALLQGDYVAPVSELEQQLAAIWAEVLKVEKVGLTDNFFELGGHSLLAVQVLARIRDQLRCEIALRELFEKSTLGDLCEVVQQKQGQVNSAQDELTKSLEALKRLSAEEIDNLIA